MAKSAAISLLRSSMLTLTACTQPPGCTHSALKAVTGPMLTSATMQLPLLLSFVTTPLYMGMVLLSSCTDSLPQSLARLLLPDITC